MIRGTLLAAGLLVLAASPVSFSGASFTSVSANPGATATAALFAHDNSKAGSAVLTPPPLRPGGAAVTGTVDLANTGEVAARFAVSAADRTDTPASPALSARLTLKVEDLGDPTAPPAAPVVLHDGTLAAFPAKDLGVWAAGERHRFRFTVSFPAVDEASDAPLQGATTSVRFAWESTQA